MSSHQHRAGTAAMAVGAAVILFGAAQTSGQTYSPPSTPRPSPAPSRGGSKVTIKGTSPRRYKFSPATLHVKKGSTVHWSWRSNAPHNVSFRKLHQRSTTARNATFQLRFAKRGTYRYVCTVHSFRGTIIVR